MTVHSSLSDSKSPWVSRTLLSILTDLNNAVVWLVSAFHLISKSSNPLSKPLGTILSAPITVIVIFYSSLARSKYLSLFLLLSFDPLFTNSPEDRISIPGRFIPKTQKMVIDTSLLNTQHYKVNISGKVEQSKEKSSALPYNSVL